MNTYCPRRNCWAHQTVLSKLHLLQALVDASFVFICLWRNFDFRRNRLPKDFHCGNSFMSSSISLTVCAMVGPCGWWDSIKLNSFALDDRFFFCIMGVCQQLYEMFSVGQMLGNVVSGAHYYSSVATFQFSVGLLKNGGRRQVLDT